MTARCLFIPAASRLWPKASPPPGARSPRVSHSKKRLAGKSGQPFSCFELLLECVTEAEGCSIRSPGKAVHQVEAGTPVEGDLEREIKCILQTDLTGKAKLHVRMVVMRVTRPDSEESTGAHIEIEGAYGSNAEVVDGHDIQKVVKEAGIELPEVRTTCEMLIGKLSAISGANTEGLRLSVCNRCQAEDCNYDSNKSFHVELSLFGFSVM